MIISEVIVTVGLTPAAPISISSKKSSRVIV
jgi:hypothetical protein